jgi:hypothetical protein
MPQQHNRVVTQPLWKSGLSDPSGTMVAEVAEPRVGVRCVLSLYVIVAKVRTECKDRCMKVSPLWEGSRHAAGREISPLLCAHVIGGID